MKRLAANADVASIIDLQRLTAILDNWPDRQPPEFSEQVSLLAVPQALGAAYFIENVTGANMTEVQGNGTGGTGGTGARSGTQVSGDMKD